MTGSEQDQDFTRAVLVYLIKGDHISVKIEDVDWTQPVTVHPFSHSEGYSYSEYTGDTDHTGMDVEFYLKESACRTPGYEKQHRSIEDDDLAGLNLIDLLKGVLEVVDARRTTTP